MTDAPKKPGRPRKVPPAGDFDIGAAVAAAVAAELAKRGISSIDEVQEPIITETDEEAQELREIREQQRRHVDEVAEADKLVAALLPHALAARHLQVFEWMCKQRGATPSQLVVSILRNEIAKQSPSYREAMGAGGSSSRDLSSLSERIPVR